jgi:integrase/recombinase XerD
MTTAAPSTALATIQPAFTDAERFALAGFLAGYRGLTREAYALDLRQFTTWCRARSVSLFAVHRADIETFARDLEARGRARATITRRLSTIAGSCKYAVQEELLDRSPAAHVRRPRIDYESHPVALDRNEPGALLAAAGPGPPAGHALISLLALNGLRVSEAAGADIEHLGLERGHRTLTVTRKGGKVVTIPLAPRTARAIDLATGERTEGPVFVARDDQRLDRHAAGRIVRKTARRAGTGKPVTPHTLRHAFITAAQGRGVASDATFRGWREGGAARDAGPGAVGWRSRPPNEPAGQDGRDRTVLRQMPGCCVHSRCTRVQHVAARATKKRSDDGRCHYRPVVTLTHSAWLVNRSLPVGCRGAAPRCPGGSLPCGPADHDAV